MQVQILNQLWDLQESINSNNDKDKYARTLSRLWNAIEEQGYTLQNPIGEKYNSNRADVDATLTGSLQDDMYISQVIKPIIYLQNNGTAQLIQKGVVIVEAKK
jgi:hypothetical protein